MTELRKASEVIRVLERHRQSGFSGWAWYSPGDSTKYRVHLIHAIPVHANGPVEEVIPYRALMVQVFDTNEVDPKVVLVTEPSPFNKFTPDMWLDLAKPPGWWAAVRPLLAVLDWTDEAFSSQDYQPGDNGDIEYGMRSRERRRPVRAW